MDFQIYAYIHIYSCLELVQQLTNLISALSHLIKGDLFLLSAGLIVFLNLAFSNTLMLQTYWEGYGEGGEMHDRG